MTIGPLSWIIGEGARTRLNDEYDDEDLDDDDDDLFDWSNSYLDGMEYGS